MLAVGLLPPELAPLINLLVYVIIIAIFIRVIMSYFPGMSYSEGGRVLRQATDWILVPIQRIVPPVGGIDFSPLIATLVVVAIGSLLISGDLAGTVLSIVANILLLLIILLFIRVFFGFFRMDPWNPVVQMIMRASEPFTRPFRRWLPKRSGQLDWAPIAALAVLFVAWELINYLNTHRTF